MRHSFHSARILRYMRKPLISMMTAGACLFFYPYHAFTAPTDGTLAGGSATISVSGNATLINQGSARAVLDWRSFDISPGELVQFIQPGASSVALNRITGGDATTILGQLTANGRVFISNPNGVVFGQGAKVDVAGLLATTLSIDADSFMQGSNAFTQANGIPSSFVVNRGEIVVKDNGFCF
ncbi:MAG: filamentous hemagglutinin N-terminal domain-containing protein, partial [Chlorobaculum sp.]|nr:filamentous hemagglutinin N-terminal domain-containing protein [Chlorobaculum sp.]